MKRLITLMALLAFKSHFGQKPNHYTLNFEISPYNLMFTEVIIQNKTYKALIDFGDFAQVQLSSALIKELKLPTQPSDIMMADVNGNTYYLQTGMLNEIIVGDTAHKDITFYSADNEIDAVSQQVGTEFQVVLGFGFFKSENFVLDFTAKKIEVGITPKKLLVHSVPVTTAYGYLIGQFETANTSNLALLFDTGTPISQIDTSAVDPAFKDTTVSFQGHQFPSKQVPISTGKTDMVLHMEVADLSQLKPLAVSGIYGLKDMKGKCFFYNALASTLSIVQVD
jgi:hypothetical protein